MKAGAAIAERDNVLSKRLHVNLCARQRLNGIEPLLRFGRATTISLHFRDGGDHGPSVQR